MVKNISIGVLAVIISKLEVQKKAYLEKISKGCPVRLLANQVKITIRET